MSSLTYKVAFNPDAACGQIASVRRTVFWRSLEELADSEGFQRWLREQHLQVRRSAYAGPPRLYEAPGASLALAGLSACSHPTQEQIVPYVNAPVDQIDGLPRFFATTLVRDGYAKGVLVESHMGRPTKIEGNPQHSASLGATDIFAQAAVLQLWDPDRSQTVMHQGDSATWDDFAAAMVAPMARFDRNGGDGLRVLTGAVTSPTLSAQLDALMKKYPRARWHVHQPAGNDTVHAGVKLVFDPPLSMRRHLDRAKIILSLDADFLTDPAAGVRYARDYAATRNTRAGWMRSPPICRRTAGPRDCRYLMHSPARIDKHPAHPMPVSFRTGLWIFS